MSVVNNSITSLIPDHDLIERIGRGGYGEVWLARNRTTDTLRAVKIVFRHEFEDERPYQREFDGLLKFEPISRSHPSQLAILHVGRNDEAGCFYYVMELADSANAELSLTRPADTLSHPMGEGRGEGSVSQRSTQEPLSYAPRTLRSEIKTRGRLPAAEVIELGRALTEALSHLHAQGLVHRDIKPANIVYVGGVPKLADIGLVTDASDNCSMVGTEGYIAPEGPGQPQADLYSLGKVLYEAATGRDRRDYPALPEDLRNWPDADRVSELNAIILKACAGNVRERYQSAEEMHADLARLVKGKSVKRQRLWQQRVQLGKKFVLTTALAGAAIAGFFFARNQLTWRNTVNQPPADSFEKSGTTNRVAWDASERAEQMSHSFTAQGLSNSLAEYQRAVTLDPNYAYGWAGVGNTFYLLGEYGFAPAKEANVRAYEAGEKARQLKPTLKYAYMILGASKLAMDYDFTAAEPLFRQAVNLDPKEDTTRLNYANALASYGRFAEAEKLLKDVIHDVPSNSHAHLNLGLVYGYARRYSEALAELDEAIRLAPNRPTAHDALFDVLWALGRHEEAARSLLRYLRINGYPDTNTALLETTLSAHGPEAFLRAYIGQLESEAGSSLVRGSWGL
ncbi:MAG: tetratricopeptide repeat protein, partial [Verrucomicrobia bacterium]|nr:tetratricopeptide repeat protein [Verrucomicrobiota bacterium]